MFKEMNILPAATCPMTSTDFYPAAIDIRQQFLSNIDILRHIIFSRSISETELLKLLLWTSQRLSLQDVLVQMLTEHYGLTLHECVDLANTSDGEQASP
jgi:hypothetical protein